MSHKDTNVEQNNVIAMKSGSICPLINVRESNLGNSACEGITFATSSTFELIFV